MKEYECDNCGKKFDRLSNYKTHITRKFPCVKKKDDASGENLNVQHQHTLNNNIICEFCSSAFTRMSSLTRHYDRCKEKKKSGSLLTLDLIEQMKSHQEQTNRLQNQIEKLQDQVNNHKKVIRRLQKENKELVTKKTNDNEETKSNDQSSKKIKSVPHKIRMLTWDKHVGEDKGSCYCLCCKTTKITQMNFQAGHVKSACEGGKTTPENLRPICSSCKN